MSNLCHWDDVRERRIDRGPVHAAWQDLGRAAGSAGCSVKRERVDPGARPTPAHSHGADEEFFYVLSGDGLSWQDGVTHPVGPGDCLFHPAAGPAHTLIAGDDGLELLVFGPEASTPLTRLPRAGVYWNGPWWLADDGGPEHPFDREPLDLPHTPGERPPTTLGVADCPAEPWGQGRIQSVVRDFAAEVKAERTSLMHWTVPAGRPSAPLHCHSAIHELFVVLGGGGEVVLGDATHPVRRGSTVARPAGSRVPHTFVAGPVGLEFLGWSTVDPNDMCWYPDSNKVAFRGLGVIARVERLEYWDGEK